MVYALRDAIGANLDRIQIVKGWLDANGKTHEKVYDVAWSPGASRTPRACCRRSATRWTSRGQLEQHHRGLRARHGLDRSGLRSEQSAFYYARVLEIPTPRWVVYDAFRFGIEIPEGAETTHQERAYTAPIWYAP